MADLYYDIVRKIRSFRDRQEAADLLREFHQHAVDEAIHVAQLCIEKVSPGVEVSELAKKELRDTYLASGFVSEDRRALARTEAILAGLISDIEPKEKMVYARSALVDQLQSSGTGVDVTDGPDGHLEIRLHPEKFALA
jgi:hypothetical protein